MIIQNLRLNPFDPTSIGIEWEVVGPIGALSFFVERSESPEGSWTTLNMIGIVSSFGFIDRTVNREAYDRNLYYRVTTIDSVSGAIDHSAPISVTESKGTNIGRFIAKQESLLLRRFNGRKVAIYIRKTFGTRCTNCYDPIRGKAIFDSCNVCYGTTFVGGYFAPIQMYINFGPRQKVEDKNVLQRNDNPQIEGWTSNYPILSPDDLVVEIERNGFRYFVKGISPTENGGATVRQNLNLVRVHPSAPQFMIEKAGDVRSIDDVNVYRTDWV